LLARNRRRTFLSSKTCKNCFWSFLESIVYLNFEGEVFLEIFDNHDKEGELDAQSLFGISWTRDIGGGDVRSFNFEDQRLDIIVRDALDMSISHFLVPNLQRLGTNTVQNGEESTLQLFFRKKICRNYIPEKYF
jgi:hypothetical protein